MSSITACLRKTGAKLDPADQELLIKIRDEHVASGMDPKEANQRAVNDMLEIANKEKAEIVQQIKDAGGPVDGLLPEPKPEKKTAFPFPSSRVSTRNPTGAKATEDPLTANLKISVEAMKLDPEQFAINADLIRHYKLISEEDAKLDDDAVVQKFIEHVVDNLLWLHDKMDPALRERARLWYVGARRLADRFAGQFDITPEAAAGMIAVLSPQKDWFENVTLAERVMDAMRNRQDFAWTPEMTETAYEIIWADSSKQKRLWKFDRLTKADRAKRDALKQIQGKKLSELTDPFLKAVWIRTYDQTYNPNQHRIITPEGEFAEIRRTKEGTGPVQKLRWGGFDAISKAVQIFEDPSFETISDSLGKEHKVRNFYNNIIAPNATEGDVTIDTHAVAAAQLLPLAGESFPVTHNFGGGPKPADRKFLPLFLSPVPQRVSTANSDITGANGLYGAYADAYRIAAEKRGILPREMQSITWEAVRGLFEAKQKGENLLNSTVEIWDRYHAGTIDLTKAREEIFNVAGEITTPSWARPDQRVAGEKWLSSYAGDVAGDGIPGRDTGAVDGGVGEDVAGAAAGEPAGVTRPPYRESDAARTQRVNTQKAYEGAAPNFGAGDLVIDYGSGLGIGRPIFADQQYTAFEPFPQPDKIAGMQDKGASMPDLTDRDALMEQYAGKADGVVNNLVLNVVEKPVRDAIAQDIAALLKPGGKAYIATRPTKDVDSAKVKVKAGDGWLISANGVTTFQKGFEQAELEGYLRDLLGGDFKVEKSSHAPKGNPQVVVTRLSGEPVFSRASAALKLANSRALVDKLVAGLAEDVRGDVVVVDTVADLVEQTKDQFDIPGDVRGMYWNGKVYIVASAMSTEKIARMVLAHELVGHYGLETMLGKEGFDTVVRMVSAQIKAGNKTFSQLAQQIRETYGNLDERTLAREVLAHFAEQRTKNPVMQRVIAAVKKWLAKIGLGNFETAFVEDLIARAATYVRSDVQKQQTMSEAVLSRLPRDYTYHETINSPEFQQWFGDSKVVNEDGTPKIVFHGSTKDIAGFTDRFWNPGNFFGTGHYFSSSFEDAGENYAKITAPDLSARIENLKERIAEDLDDSADMDDFDSVADTMEKWFSEWGMDFPVGSLRDFLGERGEWANDPEVIADWAANEIMGGANQGVIYPVYVKIENPVVADGPEATHFDIELEQDEEGNILSEGGEYYVLREAFRDSVIKNAPDIPYSEIDRVIEAFDQLFTTDALDGALTAGRMIQILARDRSGNSMMFDTVNYYSNPSAEGAQLHFKSILRDAFEMMGHDGIIMDGSRFSQMPGTAGATHYISWGMNTVKSAVGNRGTFSPYANDLVLSKAPQTWYSALSRAVNGISMKKGPARIWKQQINALVNRGVKQEEIDWSGVNEWFDRVGDSILTKDQVEYYIAGHSIELDEVKLGGVTRDDFAGTDVRTDAPSYMTEDEAYDWDGANPQITPTFRDANTGRATRFIDLMFDPDAMSLVSETPIGTFRVTAPAVDIGPVQPSPTGIWPESVKAQLNIRPIEVTLDGKPLDFEELSDNNPNPTNPYSVQGKLSILISHFRHEVSRQMAGDTQGKSEYGQWRAVKGGRNYRELLIKLPSQINLTPSGAGIEMFVPPHFQQGINTLAHARYDEHETRDGKSVLLIQEIQSDWHQKGRKYGYGEKTPDGWTAIKHTKSNGIDVWVVRNPEGRVMGHAPVLDLDMDRDITAEEGIKKVAKQRGMMGMSVVPDAPFKKTWPMLTFKRLLRAAVENGSDFIAWPTGEQQNRLYRLDKHITGISWQQMTMPPELFGEDASPNGYQVNIVTKADGVIHRTVPDNQLDDLVGAELAERIRKDATGEMKGLDLKLEGKGMKGFYDDILPKEVAKLTKKWGGQVRQIPLNGVRNSVWGVEITDDMRSAVSEGLPVFSRGGGFGMPRELSFWDKLVTKFQNQMHSLQKTQKEIGIGKGDEDIDVMLTETLYPGRVRAQIDEFERDYVKTITDAVTQGGFTFEEVGRWLHARHAREANAVLKRRNPQRVDNDALSGMTDQEAAQILAQYANDPVMQVIGQTVDLINRKRRDQLIDGDLEKIDVINAWEALYQNYVPLNREDVESTLPPRGRGFDSRGKSSKFRGGSAKKVDHKNLLARVFAQYEATLIQTEKNRVGQTLYELVQENPNPDFWHIERLPQVAYQKADGTVGYRPVPDSDNVFGVKFGGEQHWIVFNERNQHAMAIARALKNLSARDQNKLVQTLSTINRFLSTVNTSMSPEFVISNFARDIQTALVNLSDTDAEGHAYEVMKGVPSALRGIRNALRGDGSHAWAALFREFEKEGGMTGWMQHYENLEKKTEHLSRQMRIQSMPFIGKGQKLLEFIGDYNTVVENGVRLAAYKTARDLFLSEGMAPGAARMRAAQIAKELTVNFNRRGEYGVLMNAGYLFYNASIQGTARMLRTLVKSKKARWMVGSMMVAAMVLDMVNRAISDDDEDGKNYYDRIPDYIKDRNLVIMNPVSDKGDYFKIPLPWGFNVAHILGQETGAGISQALGWKRDYKLAKSAGRVVNGVLEAFNPVNNGTFWQTLMPTVLDPAMMILENKNWAGQPLYPNRFREDDPDWTKAYSSARTVSKSLAEGLNRLTGGDMTYSGVIDWSPEWIDLGIDTVTGSAGRVLFDTVDTLQKVFSGDPIESRNVPLWRKVVGDQSPTYMRNDYYESLDEVLKAEKNLKAYKGRPEFAEKVERAGPLRSIIPAAKASQKRIRTMRKQLNAAREDGNQDAIQRAQDRMDAEMKRFLKIYWHRVYGE